MSTDDSHLCPKCGARLAADAPHGLCPRCLVVMNFAAETVFTGELGPEQSAPLPVEAIAPHFPQLEVLECLGRGGMGVVYKARQKSLNRIVALKLLAPGRENDPQFAERFTREAQALAQLDHPHIVTVYDFGEANGCFYLLMEFVDGVNLRQLLQARKLTPEEALAIVPPLCEALQFAHDRGIVHRDIKPENLLLAKDGRVKIADFGIARMLGAMPGSGDDAAGTPAYMAPEQKRGATTPDNRADIYSLGVVFYEMLTGELPSARLEPPSRKVQLDVRIDEIVLRALEREPGRRYQTAQDVRAAVEGVTGTAQHHAAQTAAGGVAFVAPPRERQWLKWLGYLLLVAGNVLVLFGLAGLWWSFTTPSWNRSPDAGPVTRGCWAGALLLIGAGTAMLRMSRRKSQAAVGTPDEVRGGYYRPWHWRIAGPAILVFCLVGLIMASRFVLLYSALLLPPLLPLAARIPMVAHTLAHIESNGRAALAAQEPERVHYVFYSPGGISGTSNSGSANTASALWHDEGAVRLRNGRAFGFHRNSVFPGMLSINGSEYDLRLGVVFVLSEDGLVRHLPIFPPTVTADSLDSLAASVQRPPPLPLHHGETIPDADLRAGEWYFFHPRTGGKPMRAVVDADGARVAIHIAKLRGAADSSLLEVTFPSDPQKHMEGAYNVGAESGSIAAWEATVGSWTTQRIHRSEVDRTTPATALAAPDL